ncbi:hypothetical protein CEXT_741091 [Caerostris extrusa]|uniref:Cytochrome P450 n=1 Tax=Caerostris extrusa TaxID=172846 RepID=A0AAV4SYS7_CAEEX|nr:hypothetical protein CEXT_741091 [Caerostris extrusa]
MPLARENWKSTRRIMETRSPTLPATVQRVIDILDATSYHIFIQQSCSLSQNALPLHGGLLMNTPDLQVNTEFQL